MKQVTTKLLSTLLIVMFGWSQTVLAEEHVITVDWEDDDGFVQTNALLQAIEDDLDDDGNLGHPDRVFELQAGGFYFINEHINASYPLRLVGQEPGDGEHPPVIQMQTVDGDYDETLINAEDDLELRNLWILGRGDQGDEGWGMIDISGDNTTVTIDNIVLEYNLSAIIHNLGHGTDFTLTNSHFRNLIDHSQYWAGRVLRTEAPTERIVMENNTFFNVGHTVLQVQHPEGEVWFNHNTVVNTGRHVAMAEGVQWQNAYFTNNLLINGHWHGEAEEDFSDTRIEEEDNQYGSWITLDYLDPTLGFPDQRRIGYLNNVQYVVDDIWEFYDEYPGDVGPEAGAPAEGDTRAADFLNVRGHDLVAEWENIKLENHLDLTGDELGLQFEVDGHFNDMATNMTDFVEALRAGDEEGPQYYWEMDGRSTSGDDLAGNVRDIYPIGDNAENFTYSHAGALSHAVGDYPVGDLNWYPDEKADWEGERESLEDDIKGQFDEAVELEAVLDLEAEDGVLSGDASIGEFDGFEYYHLEGGALQWEFDLDEVGDYGLDVHHNKGDQGDRGQNVIVNESSLRNNETYGEYFFPGDQPNNEWLVEEIREEDLFEGEIDFVEGHNTVEISASWGWQYFHGVDIVDSNGDVVKSLSIFDGSISDANGTLVCEDSQEPFEEGVLDFCPSGGAWVDYGDGGDISFGNEFFGTGDYNFQLFYQLEEGSSATSVDLEVAGQHEATLDISEDSGVSEVAIASEVFIDKGSEGFTLSSDAGGFNLDRIQVFTNPENWDPVSAEPVTEVPSGYDLKQNYPNPFNPTTNIEFQIPDAADVQLTVYNVLGQQVATLVDGRYTSGSHTVEFDGSDLSSGMYIYRLEAAGHQISNQMMLVK